MSKYKAEKVNVDGYKFDSKIEAKYYEKLKDDKAKGLIENFELQPKFELQPNFRLKGTQYRKIEYVADFRVYENDGTETIIDIKGMATPEAKLKRKMLIYNYSYINLEWLVWYKGEWMDYDKALKMKPKRKKVVKNDI